MVNKIQDEFTDRPDLNAVRRYYWRHRKEILQKSAERPKPALNHYSLWYNCKWRAKLKNIEFSISRDDIKIPTHCPILGLELQHGFKSGHDNSPSVDRILLDKGYTPDNIQVVSDLANRMKSNGTLEQCIALGDWARRQLALSPNT